MDLQNGPVFSNVTQFFEQASQVMGADEMIMANGFTLNEAMSAVEIGDSRMDSGAAVPGETSRAAFDPLTPLLPEEVLWFMDRVFACEMHWHTGTALAQTVYTCLYLPHISMINPDYVRMQDLTSRGFDESRPLKLISLVVRAAVLGMVKCCDLAYRELMKGNVHDGEDWQGDKSDVSLYEGTPVHKVMAIIEEAETWLNSNEAKTLPNQGDLLLRLQLRKTLLRVYTFELPRNAPNVQILLAEARRLLALIKDHPSATPPDNSPVHSAFDPRIMRHLNSLMPLKALTPLRQEDAWKAIEGLLNGWEIISSLSTYEGLLAWDAVGNVHATIPSRARSRSPYIRSLAQSVFSSGTTVLGVLPVTFLVEAFFNETVLVSWMRVQNLFDFRSYSLSSSTVDEFQQCFIKLLLQHIWAPYHNRPRHRRHLMRTNMDWHALYDGAISLTSQVMSVESSDLRLLSRVPLSILHWRVGVVRDIVLQGFELELYSSDEIPFAYWYLSRVLQEGVMVLLNMRAGIPDGSPVITSLVFQLEYASLLRDLATAFYTVLARKSKFDAIRRWTNFTVRYKWALRKEFKEITAPDPFYPDFEQYLKEEKVLLRTSQEDRRGMATELVGGLQQRFSRLSVLIVGNPWYHLCREDFMQHILGGLQTSYQRFEGHLSSSDSQLSYSWDLDVCPWFPQFVSSNSVD